MKKKQLKKYVKSLKHQLSQADERDDCMTNKVSNLAMELIKTHSENRHYQRKLDKAHQKIGELVMKNA